MKIFLVSKSDWFISKLLIENRLKKSWYWFDSGSSDGRFGFVFGSCTKLFVLNSQQRYYGLKFGSSRVLRFFLGNNVGVCWS